MNISYEKNYNYITNTNLLLACTILNPLLRPPADHGFSLRKGSTICTFHHDIFLLPS